MVLKVACNLSDMQSSTFLVWSGQQMCKFPVLSKGQSMPLVDSGNTF